MGIFKNISSSIKVKLTEFIKSNISLTDPVTFHNTFDSYFNSSSNSNQVSWVYSCVDVWGKSFAGVKFRLYEQTNAEDKEEVTTHPIVNMFKKPNDFQTWWDIKYRFAPHWAFYGNVYLYKLRNGFGLPMGLIQLLPSNITAIPSISGGVQEYQYNTGVKMVRLNSKDVIHIPYPNGDSLTEGKSIISNIANEVEVRKFQSAYEKQFYKEGGFLGLLFSTPNSMGDAAFKRATDAIKGGYTSSSSDVTRNFKAGILTDGLQPIKSPYSIKDMDIGELKKVNMEEICAAFQVNKFMFGMAESINRATAQEISLQFASGVIEPLMTYADIILTQKLATEFGNKLFIEHDNTSPRDQASECDYYQSGIKNGWLTPNEVRNWESLQEINLDYMKVPLDLSKQKFNNEPQTVN